MLGHIKAFGYIDYIFYSLLQDARGAVIANSNVYYTDEQKRKIYIERVYFWRTKSCSFSLSFPCRYTTILYFLDINLSRMTNFKTFRRQKLSWKVSKNTKPRMFLSVKVSSFKVGEFDIRSSFYFRCNLEIIIKQKELKKLFLI